MLRPSPDHHGKWRLRNRWKTKVMAAEMSCLTGVDDDDKDAEPEINALSLLQEPLAWEMDLLRTRLRKRTELNSISTEKEEEKSITPLKTVQEIDSAGIWGFDSDSPENSLDGFSGTSDLIGILTKSLCSFCGKTMVILRMTSRKLKSFRLTAKREGSGRWTWLSWWIPRKNFTLIGAKRHLREGSSPNHSRIFRKSLLYAVNVDCHSEKVVHLLSTCPSTRSL
ncbi:unnamed protein product [Pleuronectes platessa]|uniref:Uncharacterized protein n=1 Tax=Pleuronectes platessa TaxID=8262 RepID=A0A9N7W1Q2_PLEPL|nr:unnamed protein product [Pleuronectes platessa]